MRTALRIAVAGLLLAGCIEAPDQLTEEQYNAAFPPDGGVQPDRFSPDGVVADTGDTGTTDTSEPPDTSTDTGTDTNTEPDVPDTTDTTPCIPDPEEGDPCDGVDNDCDGETDEDGGPPNATMDFTDLQGWLVTTPNGSVAHPGGPIPFAGYQAIGTTAWTRAETWQGDVRVEFALFVAKLGPGAEWFLGTWTSEEAPYPTPTSRSGLVIRYKDSVDVTVTSILNGEELDSTDVAIGSFFGAEYRINAAAGEVSVRLLQGNGLPVAEIETPLTNPTARHDGLMVSLTGGALVGSIARVIIDSGGDCVEYAVPECNLEACGSVEPCTLGVCNPLVGCEVQDRTCPVETECLTGSVCEPGTDSCTAQQPKDDGTACGVGDGCSVARTCAAGVCQAGTEQPCAPPNQCQDEGACDVDLGLCTYPSKADGLLCDDNSLCTDGETCQKGECSPATVVECPVAATCMTESVCAPDTGVCSESVAEADGTECDDGDLCTETDVCTGGACAGTPKVCDDLNPCTVDACAEGECTAETDAAECTAWQQSFETNPISGSMILLPDGAIAGVGGSVFTVEADGTPRWSVTEGFGTLTSTGLVSSDDGSHVALAGGVDTGARMTVFATATGDIAWTFDIPGEDCTGELDDPCRVLALPTLNGTGTTAWVSSFGKGLFQVTGPTAPEGEPTIDWTVANLVGTRSSVTRSAAGPLYVGQGGTEPGVRSLGADGTDRWLYATSSAVDSTPIIQGQTLYVTFGGTVVSLTDNADTAGLNWTLTLGSTLTTTDAILAANDRLIVASADTLWAIDTVGCVESIQDCIAWTRPSPLPSPISAGLVGLNDGQILYGANGGLQFLLLEDGTDGFVLPTTGLMLGTPIIGTNRLFVGDQMGTVHAFDFSALGLAGTGWPVSRRSQLRNTVE